MLEHKGFRILSDMPKLIFYLYENYNTEVMISGLWPKTSSIEEIMRYLEWYSYKLRPFMWEFYGIMTSTNKVINPAFGVLSDNSFASDDDTERRAKVNPGWEGNI
jgi:hypothetical protein